MVTNASSRDHLIRLAAWLVVIAVVLNLCLLQVPPGSELRQVLTLITRSKHGHKQSEYAWCDALLKSPGSSAAGNIWLDLEPLRTNLYSEDYLGMIYFRANYVLYPTRLYAAPASHVLNGGADFPRNSPAPATEWLREHNVRFKLTFLKNESGLPKAEWTPLEAGLSGAMDNFYTNSPVGPNE